MDALDLVIALAVSIVAVLGVVVIVHRNEDHGYRIGATLIVIGSVGWVVVDVASALTDSSMRMNTDHMRWFVLVAVLGVCMTLDRAGQRKG